MAEKRYHVVFSGEIVEGQSADPVKQRVAALFKTSARAIEPLFANKRSVIKKNVDAATAQKYAAALKRAGAICRIVSAQPPPPAGSSSTPAAAQSHLTDEEKPRQEGPRVITIPMLNKSEPDYAPQVIPKISGTSSGLKFSGDEGSEIPFNSVFAITVYNQNDAGDDVDKLMMFIRSKKHPFVCEAPNIRYADFSLNENASPTASFRGFLYFLCRKNPALFIDESTFDFLSGSPPQKLNDAGALKLSTGLGKLIESGQIASQT